MDELKVLILGDGLLGSEIEKQTGWDCISRKRNNFLIEDLDNFIPKNKYNVILNCIANTNTYSNESKSHWDVNYKFVYNLINFCNKHNVKLVHISTDYLYTGSVNNASELDVPVHCNTWYGYTKLLSDALVQLISNNFLICRLSHKPNPFPYEKAWIDISTNCDYVNVISELVIKLILKNSFGVYNVGTETKSIYDLALKTRLVSPILKPENIPSDTTMSLHKLKNEL